MGYITPLQVESIDDKTWMLLSPFVWEGSKGDIFTVEQGEKTDFATVPWWTQAILPRTGTWTKASVLHDKMCNELNRWRDNWDLAGTPDFDAEFYLSGSVFSSVDADAIFKKNAREEGTGPIRSELLWLGVRYGALVNPARRGQWWSTFPRVALDTLALIVIIGLLVSLLVLL